MWHTTSNEQKSKAVFREVLGLPDNGPPGQSGLSYYVRRDDTPDGICSHTVDGAGGEGHEEREWLGATLREHKVRQTGSGVD